MLREIKGSQRLPRLIALRVDGTGTASILEGAFDATLVDNGTGDYTLTFATPFKRVPVCVGSAVGAVEATLNVVPSVSAVQVLLQDNAGAAIDSDFHLMVLGFDSADQT